MKAAAIVLAYMGMLGCEMQIAEAERSKSFECVSATERFTFQGKDAKAYQTLAFDGVLQVKDSEGWNRTLRSGDGWKCRELK